VSQVSAPVQFSAAGHSFRLRFGSDQDHIATIVSRTKTFYEAEMLDDVRSRLFFPKVAIDVGAHVGNHTLFFAKMLGLKTFAFEPNRSSFELLTGNVRENGVEERCHLRNAGVGDRGGVARSVSTSDGNSGMARVVADPSGDIDLVTLDDELADISQVDVIKIDVEGWEVQVLRGAANVLRRCRPIVYVEASQQTFAEVAECLAAQSYFCWKRFNVTPTFLFLPCERLGVR
jgi:FkbM family methyltransferase